MNDIIKNLKTASILVADAKILLEHKVSEARILPLMDQVHELDDLQRQIGADNDTIGNHLNSFQRVGVFSERAAINK